MVCGLMGISRKSSWPYAEKILSIPSRKVDIILRHNKGGVTLLHKGRALTRCYNSNVGKLGAQLVAEAIGVSLPSEGKSIKTSVSTGVLFRAISISSLDLRIEEIRPLVNRLLDEAEEQRRI